MASPVPLIELRKVSLTFGSFRALREVSFKAFAGEKIVICGPSGSAKSTLIRCINGLEKASSGTILFEGQELSRSERDLVEVRRQVGMVFQHFNLFPHLTALENCELSLIKSKRLSREEARARSQSMLKRVGLEAFGDRFPSQLSGGQQQRVAIARALGMEPKAMLFDEPTSALDPELINEVLDTLNDLASTGMTMLCVTHEMGFARRIADRIVFMEEGQILADCPPDQFFDDPPTERVSVFLDKLL